MMLFGGMNKRLKLNNMDLLLFFFQVLIIGIFAACLEMAFQMFMQPNMFLYPWSVFIMNLAHRNEVWRHLTRVLGRCRYCNGTWVGIYIYLYFFPFDLRVLLVIGITFLLIRILTDLFTDIDPVGKTEALYNYDSDSLAPTPIKPMLQTYVIMGAFYSIVYIVIPLIYNKVLLVQL